MAQYDQEAVAPEDAPVGGGFTARQVPWLKLGTVIDRSVPAAKAIELAGLDFTVERRRTRFEGRDGKWKDNPASPHIVRADTDEPFGVVSNSYELVQYAEAFEFMDAVSPHVVAAGPLRDARQAFIVVRSPAQPEITLDGEKDEHELFVVLRTSHDRSRAVEAAALALRGRCMNQLTLQSFTAGAEQRWSIRHTKTVHERMAEARRVFTEGLPRYAEEFTRLAERLAAVELDLDAAREVITRVLPDRPKRDEQVGSILAAWQDSPTVGFAGTGWALVNAAEEYFDWGDRGGNRTDQSRLLGALEGSTHRVVNRTAALLLRRS